MPEYVCQRDGIEHAISICQRVVGDQIDRAVGQLLVESVAPLALEVTLSVQQELQARIEEVDKLRKKQVERARYEADLAQRRYLHVDPANRLVADSLEADWNEKLRALTAAQEQYEQQRQKDRAAVDEQQRARIAALASDFPRLWQDPKDSRPGAETHGPLTARRRDAHSREWDHCSCPLQRRSDEDAGVAETVDRLGTQNNAGRDCRRD